MVMALEADDEAVVVSLRDAGVAFDPLCVPPPKRRADLAQAQPGGHGASLRCYAGHVAYERTDDRNVLTIAISRAP
jgi:hypothetical protein